MKERINILKRTMQLVFFAGLVLGIPNSHFSISNSAMAQASRHQLREGNRQYNKERYDQAEVAYRRALERDTTDARGQYNLGNALYREKKYDDAARHYAQTAADKKTSDKHRAKALHNQGNSLLKAATESGQENPNAQQQLGQAISAYQEALKIDPKNDDTRYNLSLARRLLQQMQQQQQQQQQQGGGSDNKNDQKDQQNRQNQQQGQDQQDKQDNQSNQQQQQGDQQDGKQQQQQHQNKQDVKKQDAERMLEAVKNNERQTMRDRTNEAKAVNSSKKDKDW